MKKVANLVFNPFINDSRVLKESQSLAQNGYQVEVIAHQYKNLSDEESVLDFNVKRFVYFDRALTQSKLGKLRLYLKYLLKSVHYVKKFDILHCNDLNTLPIAFIVKKFFNKNIKVIYDAHEYETEVYGLGGLQKKLVKFLENFLIQYVDGVICVSDAIANEYKKFYNIEKPTLVLNTPYFQNIEKKDIFRKIFNISKDKTIFLYQGGFSRGRGIEILLEAFKKLDKKNAVIVFMGYGELEDEILASATQYENIYFHQAVTPDILLEYTSSADFGILFYENNCLNHYYCSPNKMFEYLMAELPVIVSNLYEMKRLVNENFLGIVAQKNSADGLKQAIEEALLLDKEILNTNIKKVNKMYNWQQQEKALLELYRKVEK